MARLLRVLSFLILAAALALCQTKSGGPIIYGTSSLRPVSCLAGSVYFATDLAPGFNWYVCGASGSWVYLNPTGPNASMVYPGLGVANSTGSGWGISYTPGTAANNLVQLNGSGLLPALNASLLTGLTAAQIPPLSAYEPAAGNPGVSGYVWSSTTGGVRSWVPNGSTGVPYSGATSNVNLGAYGLTAASLTLGSSFLLSPGTGTTTGNFFLGGGGQFNTSGTYNSASGNNALYSNTAGTYNAANGDWAAYNNTLGLRNTANGALSLYNNAIGSSNTANGYQSLYNAMNNYNTANGAVSLYGLTSGGYNTADGYAAGEFIYGGATPNQTSTNSVYLGAGTEALADGDMNEIAIGYNAVGLGSNTAQIGTSGVTELGVGGVQWIHGSGAPSGACATGSMYTSTIGTTTNILWACGSSAWQLVK